MKRKIFALTALLLPALAHTHSRSESFSEWQLSDREVVASITIAAREVTRLPAYEGSNAPADRLFAKHLGDRVRVLTNDRNCTLLSSRSMSAAPGYIKIELRFDCESSPVAVEYRALFEVAPSHVHFARMFSAGTLVSEALLTDAGNHWLFNEDNSQETQATFSAWLRLGLQHISGGYDHIAFVIGLLLLAGSLRNAIIAITGFTLGHSVSLAAAVYGLVSAEVRLVEAFIGFTVALVAVEYFTLHARRATAIATAFSLLAVLVALCGMALGTLDTATTIAHLGMSIFAYCYLSLATTLQNEGRGPSLLLAATGLFGLIHGLGFAGFLIDSGALGASLAAPLIGFNIGVEIGQIAIVSLLVVLARILNPFVHPLSSQFIAASLGAAGIYWYITRSIG